VILVLSDEERKKRKREADRKYLKKDFEEIQNEPIENYYAGIKSDATKNLV